MVQTGSVLDRRLQGALQCGATIEIRLENLKCAENAYLEGVFAIARFCALKICLKMRPLLLLVDAARPMRAMMLPRRGGIHGSLSGVAVFCIVL